MQQLIFNKLKQLGRPYTNTGDGFIMCKCINPQHQDKTPSFSINLESMIGKCFGCGFSVGPKYWNNGELDEEELEELERTLKYQQLLNGYHKEEEVSPTVYLPPNDGIMESGWRGIHKGTLEELDIYVCHTGSYENRVIFPMRNSRGNVAAFNTRALDDRKPKYKYSPKIKVNELVYPPMAPSNYVIIVEGILDAISMKQDGLPAIMNFGINNTIGPQKIQQLLELGVEIIYVALDSDKAGERGYENYKNSNLSDYFEIKHGEDYIGLRNFYKSGCGDYNDYTVSRSNIS